MKKLVTLSAVALAGATLGVGSTFGWWAEESKPQPDPASQIPQESKGEVIAPTEASNDSSGVQFEIIGDLQTKQPKKAGLQLDAAGREQIEQLAKELEQNAKELEDRNDKGRAEDQRRLASMVRGVLAGRIFEIHYRREKIDPQRAKNATELVAAVRKYSHWSVMTGQEKGLTRLLEAIATTEDADDRKKLITKAYALGAFGQTIKSRVEADLPEWERLKLPIGASVPSWEDLKEQAPDVKFSGNDLYLQLRAIRDVRDPKQIEWLQNIIAIINWKLKRGYSEAPPVDVLLQIQERDGDKHRPPPRPVEERDRPRDDLRQDKPHHPDARHPEPRDGDRRDHQHGEFRGPEGHHPPMGHHPGEIHGLLRALHHEIAELRGEVRDLRNLLSHERHPPLGELKRKGQDPGNGKAKHPDNYNDATGKGKVKNRDDDDDDPHLMRNYPPDYRPQGKAKNRDDDDDKGRIKNRDSDDAVSKGKAKSRDDGDDDDKSKAKNRDDDDDVEKGKAKNRDDDRESDDDKAKGEQDD